MKEKNIDKIIKEIVYIASDGTEFRDKEQCKKYEDSAKCVLMAKYKPHVIKTISEYDLFEVGSEEYMYDLFHLQHHSQIDTLIQLDFINYNHGEEFYSKLTQTLSNYVEQGGKVILIGRGDSYSKSFYIYESLEDRIGKIYKNCEV
jgi:hypothetical protein